MSKYHEIVYVYFIIEFRDCGFILVSVIHAAC